MTAIGIDLGGTKIEAQVFDDTWSVVAQRRCDTPDDYALLLRAAESQIRWAEAQAGGPVPVGIGAAGLVHPQTGLTLTANLAATDRPLPRDIADAVGRPVTYINDCQAVALSEAVFGQGKAFHTVLALTLGTGIGGGVAVDGAIRHGPTGTGGEVGHTSAPAHLVARHDLPIWQCGCGRSGCIETYVAGPGLQRLAKHFTGRDLTPAQIAAKSETAFKDIWQIWCDLAADLIHSMTLTLDPDLIVLGGGLTQIEGIVEGLTAAAKRAQISGFGISPLVLAQGGETSGARGAAYAAWQGQRHD